MHTLDVPSPENLEAMRQLHEPSPDEVAAMNDAARIQMEGYNTQYDALVQRELNPTEVEVESKYDFQVQAGAGNSVMGLEGQRLPKTKEERDHLSYELNEVAAGQTERIDRLARNMHAVTDELLSRYGIDAPNVGVGRETAEKTLLAEAVTDMHQAGGAKELDPTGVRSEQLLNQEIGQEVVKAVANDPNKLRQIAEDNPDLAHEVAVDAAVYTQTGSINRRTTQQLGRDLRDSEFTLAA